MGRGDGGGGFHAFRGHGDAVNSAAFSPDGSTVLTASCDGTAKTWDVATVECIQTFLRPRQSRVLGRVLPGWLHRPGSFLRRHCTDLGRCDEGVSPDFP